MSTPAATAEAKKVTQRKWWQRQQPAAPPQRAPQPGDLTYDAETGFANVFIPPKIPFFGGFLRVICPPGATPRDILFKVKLAAELDADERTRRDMMCVGHEECLKLNLSQYPLRSVAERTAGQTPTNVAWQSGKSRKGQGPAAAMATDTAGKLLFDGFVVPSNMFSVNTPLPDARHDKADGKTQPSVCIELFQFYTPDDTRLGSLYWAEQDTMVLNKMPLHTIKRIHVGNRCKLLQSLCPNVLAQETVDECGFVLHAQPDTVTISVSENGKTRTDTIQPEARELSLLTATMQQRNMFLRALAYILKEVKVDIDADVDTLDQVLKSVATTSGAAATAAATAPLTPTPPATPPPAAACVGEAASTTNSATTATATDTSQQEGAPSG